MGQNTVIGNRAHRYGVVHYIADDLSEAEGVYVGEVNARRRIVGCVDRGRKMSVEVVIRNSKRAA